MQSARRKVSKTKVLPSGSRTSRGSASRAALQLYKELWQEHSSILESDGISPALSHVADLAAKRYQALHASALELLLRIKEEQVVEKQDDVGYRVFTFRGKKIEMDRKKRSISDRMAKHRKDRKGALREAFCAALACLCCRLEKSWLAAYDDEAPVRGYFAHALVDPFSTFRVALKPGRLRLASLLITSELPLAQALALQDHGGPFPKGHEKEPIGDRQYGLQRIGVDYGTGDDRREKLMDVQPEEKLRDLMATKTPVLVLDVYCALAPKEHVQRYGLGDIIRQELVALLRAAKERGQAVLFLLGGEQPVELAEKVYLQPWFTSIGGLCCGYFRWKTASDKPWEMPKHHTKRVMFGLQLP